MTCHTCSDLPPPPLWALRNWSMSPSKNIILILSKNFFYYISAWKWPKIWRLRLVISLLKNLDFFWKHVFFSVVTGNANMQKKILGPTLQSVAEFYLFSTKPIFIMETVFDRFWWLLDLETLALPPPPTPRVF